MNRRERNACFVLLVIVSTIILAGCDETGSLSKPDVDTYARTVDWSKYKTFKLGTVAATYDTYVANQKTETESFDLHPLVKGAVQDVVRAELVQKGYVEQSLGWVLPDLLICVSITASELYSPKLMLIGNALFVRIEAFDSFGEPLWMANTTSKSSLSRESLERHIMAGIGELPIHREEDPGP